jgi:DNA-binding winged helix-turn-helix (wHTH) protein
MPMTPPNGAMLREYRFAHCVLDVERRELWVDGRRQTLEPKPFDVLLHLYRNRHRLVAQDELLDTVWRKAAVSPEVVAQAIAKIRQVMRRSKTHKLRVKTVYGKGYRLLADVREEPEDDTAAALLSDLHAIQERPLALVPLPGGDPAADRDLGCPLEVLGYTLAVHAMLKRMSAAEVQAGIDAAVAPTPQAIAAAIGARSPGAHVLFARLARRDETLTLEYVLVSPASRTEGTLRDRSPASLGRRLAARLLRLRADNAQGHASALDESAWMAQMFDLASRAAEEYRRSEAVHVLDVVLDQDPDHDLAMDLKARIEAGHVAPDGTFCASTCSPGAPPT